MMEYKSYVAGPITFDEERRLFHGEVAGLRDVVTFQARSADELVQAFRDSVDDYLEMCAEDGVEPDRPYNGTITLRLDPDKHREIALKAAADGLSLNQWIARRLTAA